MVKKTRKYKKGGSRAKTSRAYSLRPHNARAKSVIAPILNTKTVDELTPAEFNAIFRTVTSKKGWDTKTSRQ